MGSYRKTRYKIILIFGWVLLFSYILYCHEAEHVNG